jgi:hypothetical protein
MDEAICFLQEKNKSDFDGFPFSLFGRGYREVVFGEDNKLVDCDYYIDSVLLTSQSGKYFTFFIRCIDSDGNLVELD